MTYENLINLVNQEYKKCETFTSGLTADFDLLFVG